jgi:hypothetical protein
MTHSFSQKSDDVMFQDETFGFLSMSGLEQRESDAEEQGFKLCKNVKQCSELDFMFHGDITKREVHDSSTTTQKMRARSWDDTEQCGIFGILLEKDDVQCDKFYPSSSSKPPCCKIDNATAVQYFVLCDRTTRSLLQNEINTRASLPLTEIEDVCEYLGDKGVYVTSTNADTRDIQVKYPPQTSFSHG